MIGSLLLDQNKRGIVGNRQAHSHSPLYYLYSLMQNLILVIFYRTHSKYIISNVKTLLVLLPLFKDEEIQAQRYELLCRASNSLSWGTETHGGLSLKSLLSCYTRCLVFLDVHFSPLTSTCFNFLSQLSEHHSEIMTPCRWNLASLGVLCRYIYRL